MQLIIVVAALFAVALARPHVYNVELDSEWEMFKSVHKKHYINQEEELHRRQIWEDHVDLIAKHNREYDMGLHTYTLGINEYADMSTEEFVQTMNGYVMSNGTSGSVFLAPSQVQVPDEVDWRKEGYVTEVKNQGHCGSCWAFSTTGSLEGQHFKKTGTLTSLSEQNLVDCSRKYGNMGCKGGLMDNGFKYIRDNNGIDTEASYPYTAKTGLFCHFRTASVGATCTGYTDIKRGSESDLQAAVATVGPISVAIDAGHKSFQLYKRGVYSERACSSKKLDHGVLVVGYGTDNGQEYWLVKNSWGPSWGMDGYVEMSRNKNNQCGIATQASYPLV
ncbi:cathepsin L1-like [Lingula anatina]|uniref:Cathepsin L1-like n=1 Tax=Lingula anatina TaxID=7574 RepID=A0A1S3JYJ7_LINAN|nr:cathepsin L1-like [Lingula anatina]XP_013415101.1 cathepsin L1-like [Lingula anatina]|eukprot:XP_013415099.1 cathepsin L1-like [Lingula anatina]